MDVSWGPLVGMQLHAAHGRTDTHPRKAEKWEAWRPVHSPGPYSLGLGQKAAWGPEAQPAPPSFKRGAGERGGNSRAPGHAAGAGGAESQAVRVA